MKGIPGIVDYSKVTQLLVDNSVFDIDYVFREHVYMNPAVETLNQRFHDRLPRTSMINILTTNKVTSSLECIWKSSHHLFENGYTNVYKIGPYWTVKPGLVAKAVH